MREKIKNIANTVLFILLGNALYGVLLYFLVTWLAGYSLLFAYLGNLLFIFVLIVVDEFAIRRTLRAESIYAEIIQIKHAHGREAYLRFLKWALTYRITFKTFLFVFYVAVLIFAQILKFYPSLVAADISNFINIIEYSVIILLALKDFGEEFSRDRDRANVRLAELEQYLEEHPLPK